MKSSRRRGSRKTDVDTDDSDSDPDQLTSSRTESSNQLDAGKIKHSELLLFSIKFYGLLNTLVQSVNLWLWGKGFTITIKYLFI